MDVITDPDALPGNVTAIPGDTLINAAVWAKLQGVALQTVYRNNTLAGQRRRADQPKRGDMPRPDMVIGQTPVWFMSSYRSWEASRPGKGAGAGRPRASGATERRVRVSLPILCPHCEKTITAADLGRQPAAG